MPADRAGGRAGVEDPGPAGDGGGAEGELVLPGGALTCPVSLPVLVSRTGSGPLPNVT
jgi:hypothetical protein